MKILCRTIYKGKEYKIIDNNNESCDGCAFFSGAAAYACAVFIDEHACYKDDRVDGKTIIWVENK